VQITFDIDIDAADQVDLIAALECDAATLNATLNRHAKAALREYVECYVGRRAFARGTDIMEHRLSLLVAEAFDRKIPTAATVSNLFQTTLSASRTLIRNTFSKYRFQLTLVEKAAAKAVLEAVEWNGADGWFARITTPNLVEVLNRKLLSADPSLKAVSRVAGAVGVYLIDQDAYTALCAGFDAAARQPPA